MARQKPALIDYSLTLHINDTTDAGNVRTARKYKKTYAHKTSQISFEAVFERDYFKKLNALEQTNPQAFEAETALFQEYFADFLNGDADDTLNLLYDICEYIQKSEAFGESDKIPLHHFLVKFVKSQKCFADFNARNEGMSAGEHDITDNILALKNDLKAIWGSEVKFINNSAQKLAEGFTKFDEILDELDGMDKPLSPKAKVSYSVRVNDVQGLSRSDSVFSRLLGISKAADILNGEVEYSQLPRRFNEIRQYLGISNPNQSDFRLSLDVVDSDLKNAFRVSAEGNNWQQLRDGIQEQVTKKTDGLDTSKLTYKFTLIASNPAKAALIVATPAFLSLAGLENDFSDTLITLSNSGHKASIPSL